MPYDAPTGARVCGRSSETAVRKRIAEAILVAPRFLFLWYGKIIIHQPEAAGWEGRRRVRAWPIERLLLNLVALRSGFED